MTELKLKPSGLAQALDTAYRADVVPIVLGQSGDRQEPHHLRQRGAGRHASGRRTRQHDGSD